MQNIKLTWTEAKEAMKEGRRVEHSYFCGGEWFEMRDGVILDEHGYNMETWFRGEAWQEEDWSVIEEEDNKEEREMRETKMPELDYHRLELLVAASFATGDTMWQTPVSRVDNQNKPSARNHKLYKGKGHNKLKKGKKK
ncbi:hypothetical protein MOO17_11335 [Escherichia coli]|uniref:hypothetical protein n=1 Tax=Escherichia coli TaxID=562 RepID=UPI001FF2F06F|nr:hypothetical protein [Escherichia coli]MCJ8478622.1 hypothetical protein [Escherichia coli]